MRKQREKRDFWDEYKDTNSDSSSDELSCDEFSSGKLDFEEKNQMGERNNTLEDGTSGSQGERSLKEGNQREESQEEGNWKEKAQLEAKKLTFDLTWKKSAGDYLWGDKRYGSLATDKRNK